MSILREIFVRLGLQVDKGSFDEGKATVQAMNLAAQTLINTALGITKPLISSVTSYIGALSDLSDQRSKDQFLLEKEDGKTKESIERKEKLSKAIESLDEKYKKTTISLSGMSSVMAAFIKPLVPLIERIGDRWNRWLHSDDQTTLKRLEQVGAVVARFGEAIAKLFDVIVKNWDTVKIVLAGLVVGFAIVHAAAVAAAVATAAAWIIAAAPFIAIGAAITGIILLLDDFRVYMAGGNSLLGIWIPKIQKWLEPKKEDPAWLVAAKDFIRIVGVALGAVALFITKPGAVWAAIKDTFGEFGEWLASLDWSPITDALKWIEGKVLSIDWRGFFGGVKGGLLWVKQEVSSVDFKSWWLGIKKFGLELEGVYFAVVSLIDKLREAWRWVIRINGGKDEDTTAADNVAALSQLKARMQALADLRAGRGTGMSGGGAAAPGVAEPGAEGGMSMYPPMAPASLSMVAPPPEVRVSSPVINVGGIAIDARGVKDASDIGPLLDERLQSFWDGKMEEANAGSGG